MSKARREAKERQMRKERPMSKARRETKERQMRKERPMSKATREANARHMRKAEGKMSKATICIGQKQTLPVKITCFCILWALLVVEEEA
jgi:hypothetical protein